ncbi:MAG: type II secretion system F family protein [Propioniciclava sp.]
MTPLLIALGAAVAVVVALLGMRDLFSLSTARRRVVHAAELDTSDGEGSSFRAWDARFRRTRLGRYLVRELDLAGIHAPPLAVAFIGLVVGVAAGWAIWAFLAPPLALVGIAVGVLVVRWYLSRAQLRRQDAIVAQLPDLARVLANASYAGLSLSSALRYASTEINEPSRSEIARVAQRLRYGAPVSAALDELRDRVKSREVSVLIATLIISARSGGSLVTSLRTIAESLDQRKETRRQIRTILSGPSITATSIILMGIGALVLMNAMQPGTVDTLIREPLGVGALVLSAVLFAAGWLIVRAMVRIDP